MTLRELHRVVGSEALGKDVAFKATIKEHVEYTDKTGITTKQTVLTRCTLI